MIKRVGLSVAGVALALALVVSPVSGQIRGGLVNLASDLFVTGRLAFTHLAQGSARSVLGVTGASTADVASIASSSDGDVLRRASGAVGFGTIPAASISDLGSATVAFTNKSGAISQWTNDASYTTLSAVAGVGYLTSVTAHSILSATHGDTLADTLVRGDLLYVNSTPKLARLAKPSVLSGLSHDGTDTSWVTATGTGAPVRGTSPTITTSLLFANGQGFLDVAADITGLSRGTNAQKLQIYETRDTGLSNYSRLSISTPALGPITFASEAAGTGTARGLRFSQNGSNFDLLSGVAFADAAVRTQNGAGYFALGNGASTRLFILAPSDSVMTLTGSTGVSFTRLQLGDDVNGVTVSSTIQGQNAITGSNLAGGNLTLRPGAGTGTGTISALIFQSPTLGSTGTTAQTQTTRFTIDQTSARATVPVTGTRLQSTTIYSAAGTALPACNGAAEGTIASVSDATAPLYGATYTSGGAVHSRVFCDGTNWIH